MDRGRDTAAAKAPAVKDQGEYDLTVAIQKETDPQKQLDLLRQWEQKSSKIKSLRGEHKRFVYNLVFEEEKIAFPEGIRLFQQGRIQAEGRRVRIVGADRNEK